MAIVKSSAVSTHVQADPILTVSMDEEADPEVQATPELLLI